MNAENIIAIAAIVFASTGLWGFLTKIYDNRRRKKTPQEEMLLALVRDKLITLSKHYIGLGHIPDDELEMFLKMGESYIGNGGNSAAKVLFEQAKAMPVQVEEVEENGQ